MRSVQNLENTGQNAPRRRSIRVRDAEHASKTGRSRMIRESGRLVTLYRERPHYWKSSPCFHWYLKLRRSCTCVHAAQTTRDRESARTTVGYKMDIRKFFKKVSYIKLYCTFKKVRSISRGRSRNYRDRRGEEFTGWSHFVMQTIWLEFYGTRYGYETFQSWNTK